MHISDPKHTKKKMIVFGICMALAILTCICLLIKEYTNGM